MEIRFEEINENNFEECMSIDILEHQKGFVHSTAYSLAQAKIWPFWIPRAIYDENVMVGFAMYSFDYDEKKMHIVRLIVDQHFQNKGYGRLAIHKLIELWREDKRTDRIMIHVEAENVVAKSLYEAVGFVDQHKIEYGQETLEYSETK